MIDYFARMARQDVAAGRPGRVSAIWAGLEAGRQVPADRSPACPFDPAAEPLLVDGFWRGVEIARRRGKTVISSPRRRSPFPPRPGRTTAAYSARED